MPFTEKFVSAGESGSAVNTTSSATSVIPAARKITLPAYFFDRVGKRVRIRAAGRIGTKSATPGTITWIVRFGSVDVFNGGASGTVVTSRTNDTWLLDITLRCESIGSGTSATMLGTGKFETVALSSTTPVQFLPATAPAAGTGFDSTASQTVDLLVQWSVSDATNTITCHQFEVESDT